MNVSNGMNKGYEETEPMESFHSFTQENIFSCNAEKNLIHTHIYIYSKRNFCKLHDNFYKCTMEENEIKK